MQQNLAIYFIGRIREKANRFIRSELAKCGLESFSPSHGDIFLALFQNEALTMKELAEMIDRDKSTVTGLVEKLMNMGFIEKTPDGRDGRVFNIRLTSKGKELKPQLMTISEALVRKVTKGLNPDEQKQLEQLLARVNSNWI